MAQAKLKTRNGKKSINNSSYFSSSTALFTMTEVGDYLSADFAVGKVSTPGGGTFYSPRAPGPTVQPKAPVPGNPNAAVPTLRGAGQNIKKGVGELVQYTTRTGKKAFRKMGARLKSARGAVAGAAGRAGSAIAGAAKASSGNIRWGAGKVSGNIRSNPRGYAIGAGIAAVGGGGAYLLNRDR